MGPFAHFAGAGREDFCDPLKKKPRRVLVAYEAPLFGD
jgi:hypothetical protein